jgi:hypothetical protein
MTVRQLHYTSCEDGLEGIQGFQVSAMTPGIPKPMVDLAVRSSGYEAGPALLAHLGDGDTTRFPIAFGYVINGGSAAVFQSRYAGTDFTGRAGNYFAHALVLDDPEHDLAGLLPIDLWRSPAWADSRPATGTELPGLTALPAGGAADAEHTRRFLAQPGGVRDLGRLISAVQPLLATGRGRLVLAVPDDSAAAMWLAALSRSLPRALCLRISFITYTARPEQQDVMVSCTTPDVQLPAYGDFTVLDLTARGSGEQPTRYAMVLAGAWSKGTAETVVRLAERLDPPLTGAELDAFAAAHEITAGGDQPVGLADEPLLLAAITLGLQRPQLRFDRQAWHRVTDLVRAAGGPRDLAGWSVTLQAALRGGDPVPAALLGSYLIAKLTAPSDTDVPGWVPTLGAAELDDIAENVVLPAVSGRRPPAALLRRLDGRRDLCDALARVLERRLVDPDEFERLATTLAPDTVTVLTRSSGLVAGLRDVVQGRAGVRDRVQVLIEADHVQQPHRHQLGGLLWPDELSADESVRLLRSLPLAVLDETGLAVRIVTLAVRDRPPALVDQLLRSPLGDRLAERDRAVLVAVALTGELRKATPDRHGPELLAEALGVLGYAPPGLAGQLLDSLSAFVLRAEDPALHTRLLEQAMSPRFLDRYREHARAELAKVSPDRVAAAILAWDGLSDPRIARSLCEQTLPAALSRRRAKYLDKVGTRLAKRNAGFGGRSSRRSKDWAQWWMAWRATHERRGLFGLLRRKAT